MRSGQALVLVLLVLAVGLTTGLAVVSRSVTDIATTTTQEESSRSLSAAEAGVEAKLSGSTITSISSGTGSIPINVGSVPAEGDYVTSPEALVAGESATFKLEGYIEDKLFLCWEKEGSSETAIEATLYYESGTDINVKRWAFDQSQRGGFVSPSGANAGTDCPPGRTYDYAASLSGMPLGRKMLRARLFYNGDSGVFVGVKKFGSAQFPNQGQKIDSSAQSGDTTRKLQVENRDPDMSPLLDTAVFSGSNLEKN